MNRIERMILRLPVVAFILKKSKQLVLPGFQGMPLYDVLDFFFQQVKKIGFSERAAAISFNILVALPAALIFLCTLVPYLPQTIHFEEQLLGAVRDILRNQETYRLVEGVVNDFFNNPRKGLLSFSFLAGVYFSSNAMMGIMHTFDRSYFEERSSRFLAKRWTAIKLTSLLVLLIITSVLLLATQCPIKTLILQKMDWDNAFMRTIIDWSRWVIILMVTYFTIAFIYRWGPAVKVRWSLISPGTILASSLVILTTLLFSIWVNNFASYNKVYGSIGTVLIIMNLVYINSLILLVGFEINVSITAIKMRSRQRLTQEAAEQPPNF
ncbi:MAG TPA: YihY/virulence factor BrkB family protein [Phnomibacter sp.]|nr:YihY/virulence factor BrkB family protein [Phnomibacter sp.]